MNLQPIRVGGGYAHGHRSPRAFALMSPREGKSEAELRALVYAEGKEWREEIRGHLAKQVAKQEELSDTMRDAAQVAGNLATILTGDPKYGVEGKLPEITRRLGEIEVRAAATDDMVSAHHAENVARLDKIEEGQERSERNQHRMRRSLSKISIWLTTEWKRVALFAGGLAWVMTVLSDLFPKWATLKFWLARLLIFTKAGH